MTIEKLIEITNAIVTEFGYFLIGHHSKLKNGTIKKVLYFPSNSTVKFEQPTRILGVATENEINTIRDFVINRFGPCNMFNQKFTYKCVTD